MGGWGRVRSRDETSYIQYIRVQVIRALYGALRKIQRLRTYIPRIGTENPRIDNRELRIEKVSGAVLNREQGSQDRVDRRVV
jgi:hypothetical protein